MKKLCFTLLVSSLAACSLPSLKTSELRKSQDLHVQWGQDTTLTPYVGFRIAHRYAPVFNEQNIFAGNAIDNVSAYDLADGSRKWSVPVANGVEGGLLLAGNRLFFGGNDLKFYAVNSANGKILWTFSTETEVLSKPSYEDGIVYFLTGANVLYAVDAKSGKLKWKYSRPASSNITVRGASQPVLNGNRIYIGFSDGFFTAINKTDGSLAWERLINQNPKFKDIDATAVIDGSQIYISGYDSFLYALSLKDGQIQWRFEGGSSSPVLILEDSLYYATSNGKFYSMEKRSGKIQWQFAIKGGIFQQPVAFGKNVVVGASDGSMYVFSSQNDKPLFTYTSGNGVASAAAVDIKNQRFFFISNASDLYSIQILSRNKLEKLPWESGTW